MNTEKIQGDKTSKPPGSPIKCKTCKYKCDKCDKIARFLGESNQHYINTTLCWCCEKSTTNGCSWAKNFQPVSGWVAIKKERETLLKSGADITYRIRECPEFRRG